MPRKVDDDLFIEDGEIDYQESEYFDDVKTPTSPATKKKVAHEDDGLGEEEFAEEEEKEEE